MAGLLADLRKINNLGNRAIAEPFAGGAGASLCLLCMEETPLIHINDADPAIHDFWWALLNLPEDFMKLLSKTQVNLKEWYRQRMVYRSGDSASRLARAFAVFYLNRCNRSGIILNGGPIGGIAQKGEWKLDARYNKAELLRRCERLIQYRERIRVTGKDGIRFIEDVDPNRTFFFIDPPYFEKGPTLYLNALDTNYHNALASRLKPLSDAAWALTYDDCPEIRSLYSDWASVRPYRLPYVAAKRRRGKELLITPKWMQLPRFNKSAFVEW